MSVCCNHVVGVLITDPHNRLLMFQRATPPAGVAPVAGHVDQHGSPDQAAHAEVWEEVGLTVTSLEPLFTRHLPHSCGSRQQPGPEGFNHHWTVYRAAVTGAVHVDEREARRTAWHTPAEVQALADRTVAYATGHITDDQFTAQPGLEPVWVLHLHHLGNIHVPAQAAPAIRRLCARHP